MVIEPSISSRMWLRSRGEAVIPLAEGVADRLVAGRVGLERCEDKVHEGFDPDSVFVDLGFGFRLEAEGAEVDVVEGGAEGKSVGVGHEAIPLRYPPRRVALLGLGSFVLCEYRAVSG